MTCHCGGAGLTIHAHKHESFVNEGCNEQKHMGIWPTDLVPEPVDGQIRGISSSSPGACLPITRLSPQGVTLTTVRSTSSQSKPKRGVLVPPIRNKAMLLPLPLGLFNHLSIEHHLKLEALHSGSGEQTFMGTMAEILFVSCFMAEDGFGNEHEKVIVTAQDHLFRAHQRGVEKGAWSFDDAAYAAFGRLLTLHDEQLRHAPAYAVFKANERMLQSIRTENQALRRAMAEMLEAETV
jgi:hypothetical protein